MPAGRGPRPARPQRRSGGVVPLAEVVHCFLRLLDALVDLFAVLAAGLLVDEAAGLLDAFAQLVAVLAGEVAGLLLDLVEHAHGASSVRWSVHWCEMSINSHMSIWSHRTAPSFSVECRIFDPAPPGRGGSPVRRPSRWSGTSCA